MFFLILSLLEGIVRADQSLVERIPLITAQLEAKKTVSRVEVKRIDFPPRQRLGLHTHPCPVVGYIASGSIFFQIEGEEGKILKAGDAFFEPADKKIAHFDNASRSESARFVAFYLEGTEDREIIRMLH